MLINCFFYRCECSCDNMVDIERPSVLLMILSHLSQSIVVTIVGLNLGFRYVVRVHLVLETQL